MQRKTKSQQLKALIGKTLYGGLKVPVELYAESMQAVRAKPDVSKQFFEEALETKMNVVEGRSNLSIDECLDAYVILFVNKPQIAEQALTLCVSGKAKAPATLADFIDIEQSKMED